MTWAGGVARPCHQLPVPTSWEPFCDGSGVAGTVGGGIDGGTDGSCVESWVAICAFCCAVKSGNSPWLALGTAGTGAGAAGALESWVRSITGRWLCSGKASKSSKVASTALLLAPCRGCGRRDAALAGAEGAGVGAGGRLPELSRMATLNTARKLCISRATPSAAIARLQSTEPDAAPKRSSNRAEPSRTPRLSKSLAKTSAALAKSRSPRPSSRTSPPEGSR
mmetsp:Transcript_46530/g.101260  ORF Transcript_46530/g.101260 Transcript_46530/m.101260 type:complete len:223 (-) Transcript_46530:710-1378(-)